SLHVQGRAAKLFLIYEVMIIGAIVMLMPFYWMLVTSFKDGQTSSASPPVWTPSRMKTLAPSPETGTMVPVVTLGPRTDTESLVRVVPEEAVTFQRVEEGGVSLTREVPDLERVFMADPSTFEIKSSIDVDLKNFRRAWYRPE